MKNKPEKNHPLANPLYSMGWLINEIERIPSPNFDSRPSGTKIDLLVIHNISLPPEQFGSQHISDFFCNRLKVDEHPFFKQIADVKVSAHFLIRRNGNLIQFVSVLDRAWHAGKSEFCGQSRCNDFSIGIELEGTDTLPYEHAQYISLARLTHGLMQAFPAITTDRIVGHSDIAPARKTDPGPAFNWDLYKQLLR